MHIRVSPVWGGGGDLVAPYSFPLLALLVGARAKGRLQNSAPGAWRDSCSRTLPEDTLGAKGEGVGYNRG